MDGKCLGKIQSIDLQLSESNRQIEIWLSLGGEGWGVNDGFTPGFMEGRGMEGEKSPRIVNLLQDAKVRKLSQLINKPVEATFEENMLKSWRILTEVL